MKQKYLAVGAAVILVAAILTFIGISGKISAKNPVKASSKSQSSSAPSQVSSAASSSEPKQESSSAPPQQSSDDSGQRTAYLTYDDGPSKYTPGLLDILRQNNVKATFFVAAMGHDTQQRRDWIKAESDSGNVVGIHSFTHEYGYIYANEQNFLDDLQKIMKMITETTGKTPSMMRFPGGLGNTVSIDDSGGKLIMPKLVSDVEGMGITPYDWNVGGEDAESKNITKDELINDILKDASGQKNIVILLHDIHEVSVQATPELISRLKAQGYVFKALGPGAPTEQEHFAKKSRKYKDPAPFN